MTDRGPNRRGVGRLPGRNSLQLYSARVAEPRERSGSDVGVVLLTLVPAALLALVAAPTSAFEKALIGLFDALPPTLDILWRLGVVLLGLWVLALVADAMLRRRWDVLADVALSGVVGLAVAMLFGARVNGSWPSIEQIVGGGSAAVVPLVLLVVASATAYAAAPHLTSPMRVAGRVIVGVAVFSTVVLDATTPSGALISILVGAAAAALVHLGLGTSTGRPTIDDVTVALDELGLPVEGLVAARRQRSGVVTADGTDLDGQRVHVKVYGRDARDSQLLQRLWRSVWFRGSTSLTVGRQQQVEHEAFVTLLAASRGLPVPRVEVAGLTDRHDAVLAVRGAGVALSDLDGPVDGALVPLMWDVVGRLHADGMSHGDISLEAFGVDDGSQVVLRKLGSASLSATEAERATDLAQLVTVSALVVGIERVVLLAADELGPDGVEGFLPYLQVVVLGHGTRLRLKASPIEMEALRSALAAVVDVEVPDVVELRRVSPQAFVTAGLLVLVAAALIGTLANVDLSELVDELANASPGWVVVALVVGQLAFVAQAVGTRGAAPKPVPLGPLTMLQASIAFVALAVPSTAGRLALDVRFFQRQGIPAATALSISAIDGFSGFLVQMAILLLTLVVGVGQVDLSFEPTSGVSGSGGLVTLLAVIAVVFVLGAVATLVVPKLRARLIQRVGPILGEVRETLRSLRSPLKLLELFGGNFLNQVIFAATLGICLHAFGADLNLATLLVIYVGAALFGGLMPVPGGIGVMEAALMTGLIAGGISTTTASATAILFRLITYFLPPLWGWLALRWLQRRSYL